MDKYLVARNEMSDNGCIAIIRTVQPVSHFEVIPGWKEVNELHKYYTYLNSDGIEEHYTLSVHHYFSTDIDTVNEKEVFKFMDDAWHWYKAYMTWEDKQ